MNWYNDGELVENPCEAQMACWMFEQYLADDSLGKIAAGMEAQGILSPTGRSKWNREAIDKLPANEYTWGGYCVIPYSAGARLCAHPPKR